MRAFWQKFTTTLEMVKFSHSIFALPFALISTFYATHGRPSAMQFALICGCMISARSAAMAFNRIVDRDLDAQNPRTQNRPLISGALSVRFATIFCAISSLVFLILTSFFNRLTLFLAPLALIILFAYSLTKRVTDYTQFFLGLALGCSPPAAWIALTGKLAIFPSVLGVGVFFWVAGFDLIYATQDHSFDREYGVKSLVVKLGITHALRLARWLHVYATLSFLVAGAAIHAGWFYYIGLTLMAGILFYEHLIVKPNDLSRVNQAFFTLNGMVAVLFCICALVDLYFAA